MGGAGTAGRSAAHVPRGAPDESVGEVEVVAVRSLPEAESDRKSPVSTPELVDP